jgi:hypothetical protein
MKILAAVLAVLAFGCEPAINPPPIPPPVQYVLKEIFWHAATVDRPGEPPTLHSCAITAPAADQSLRATYTTVDPVWWSNGWAFWKVCVIAAADLGYAIPFVKDTGDPNTPGQTPLMSFKLTSAPIFGKGAGSYNTFNAANLAVWRKGYVEASG